MTQPAKTSFTSINIIDLGEALCDWLHVESKLGNTPSLDLWRVAFESVMSDYENLHSKTKFSDSIITARFIIHIALRNLLSDVRVIPEQGKLHGHIAVIKCRDEEPHG